LQFDPSDFCDESIVVLPWSGCWIWVGPDCARGRYGRLSTKLKNELGEFMAHRGSYRRFKGDIAAKTEVCHSCDVGVCVNPHHLFLGTHSENMIDCARKGRLAPVAMIQRGSLNRNAKYDAEFAARVRLFYQQNSISFSALAAHFGLKSKGHAHAIVKGRIWAES
jgi:hypothetical protein